MAYAFGMKKRGTYLGSPIYNPNTLKAYFPFRGSTTTDFSGNGLTLTQANTVNSYRNNRWDGSADFGSSDGHTNLLYRSGTDSMGVNIATGQEFTVAFLFKPNAVPSTGVGRVIDFGGGSSYLTLQYRNNSGTIQFDTATGGGASITKVVTLQVGRWYRIVFTMNKNNNGMLYFDAVPEPATAVNGGSASGANCGIGNANNSPGSNSNGCPCSMAELVIDQRYWTPDMVLRDFQWVMGKGKLPAMFNGAKKLASPATDVTVASSVVSATFSTQAPTVTGNATVSPNVVSAAFSTQAPTITGTANVTASVVSAAFSIPLPNIITPDAQVSATVQTATFSIPSATASGEANVSAGVLSAVFSTPAPSVQIGFTHAANAQSATFSIPTPTVSAISNITVSASVLTATFSVQSPTVTAEINGLVEPSVLTATFSTQAPTVSAQRQITVDASVVSALFSVQSPRKVGGLWAPQPRVEGVWTAQPRISG